MPHHGKRRCEKTVVGREGSKYGIEDFLEVKYLAMSGLAAPLSC